MIAIIIIIRKLDFSPLNALALVNSDRINGNDVRQSLSNSSATDDVRKVIFSEH